MRTDAIKENKFSRRLLKKMLVIETIGQAFYGTLAHKTSNQNLKAIYERLALNEKEIAKSIKEELLRVGENGNFSNGNVLFNSSNILFNLLLPNQLLWLLKVALRKGIYRKWFIDYGDCNCKFWNLLLNHENLQLKLLQPLLT